MYDAISYNRIVDTLASKLGEISGIGRIDTTPGGPSPWSEDGDIAFHSVIDIFSCQQKIVTNPGVANQMTVQRRMMVLVETKYPYSQELGSAIPWRNMLDNILLKIERNASLGLGMMIESGPNVVRDEFQDRGSMHQGDVKLLCHVSRIATRWNDEYVLNVVA